MESTTLPTGEWMDKDNMVHSYSRTLFGLKEDGDLLP